MGIIELTFIKMADWVFYDREHCTGEPLSKRMETLVFLWFAAEVVWVARSNFCGV